MTNDQLAVLSEVEIREALAAVISGEKFGVYYPLANCIEWLNPRLRDVIVQILQAALAGRLDLAE